MMEDNELMEIILNNALQHAEAQRILIQAYWEGMEKLEREYRIKKIKLTISAILCYAVLAVLIMFGIYLMCPD